ncbi:HET-domain-containing protein [Hypoxylon cercidicola]|nr:HET-domain-containing protein [Hypoxylon cercidicola]
MRLINTSTGWVEEFLGRNIPKYAILSHTWEEEEVSFKDMSNSDHMRKKGYRKICKTCQMASQAGIPYAWVDTCCIDKSSGAELTEAINSMYRWYERAEICYVYLSDLPASAPLNTALRRCRWNTRGWTLQELVAPENIDFFDQDWNNIGSKQRLVRELEKITGIGEKILLHKQPLKSVLVAHKMSWAARRETTRIEDTAYCLLGIFGVNMPLLYGEEEKAFRRLQEEIIKSTPDLSIFAWTIPKTINPSQGPDERVYSGILAESPAAFSMAAVNPSGRSPEFSVTNKGIKSQVAMFIGPVPGKRGERYVLPLHNWSPASSRLGILLRKFDIDQFVREDPSTLIECSDRRRYAAPQEIYCPMEFPLPYKGSSIAEMRPLFLQFRLPPEMRIKYESVEPKSRYDVEDQLFFTPEPLGSDPCTLSLSLDVSSEFKAECTFIIASWWSGISMQYSLVHDEPFHSVLDDIRDKLGKQTCSNWQMLRYLASNNISRSRSVVISIPGGHTNVLISARHTLDPISQMVLSFEILETRKVPTILREKWEIEEKSRFIYQ